MRPEAMMNGNRLFMNCDFFREHVLLPLDEAGLSDEERDRLRDHKHECLSCNDWMLAQYKSGNVCPEFLPYKANNMATIRGRIRRLLAKRSKEASASTRRV